MTIEEVIRELRIQRSVFEDMILYNKDFNPKHDNESLENRMKAWDMAVAVLGKQIPKKPDFEGDGYSDGQLVYDTWICPNCEKRYEVDYEEYDHCPNCGQHINWSEVEEC